MRGRRLVALLVIGVVLFPASAAACSCAPRSPGESLQEADGAVVGWLVKVVPHGALHAVYRYRVLHVYKGSGAIEDGTVLSVRSARRAAACALPRRASHRYGLFLARHHGRWYGGICGVVEPARMRQAAQHRPRVYRRASGGPLCAA